VVGAQANTEGLGTDGRRQARRTWAMGADVGAGSFAALLTYAAGRRIGLSRAGGGGGCGTAIPSAAAFVASCDVGRAILFAFPLALALPSPGAFASFPSYSLGGAVASALLGLLRSRASASVFDFRSAFAFGLALSPFPSVLAFDFAYWLAGSEWFGFRGAAGTRGGLHGF
jgi:hypothetical protein